MSVEQQVIERLHVYKYEHRHCQKKKKERNIIKQCRPTQLLYLLVQ